MAGKNIGMRLSFASKEPMAACGWRRYVYRLQRCWYGMLAYVGNGSIRALQSMRHRPQSSYAGQSTTEYAILVGVLVVIAMVAILAFKSKVQELWNAIADGINAL